MEYENTDPVPNWILTKAVDKLHNYGYDIFEMYANEKGLSFCDRNRCISKAKIIYRRDDLQEMTCPDELKQKRWKFYTKTLRYSAKKAREFIYELDCSYKKPFTPHINVGTLSSKIG